MLVALAVVVVYFGARALNRFRVSFAARDAAIETLIPLMGVAPAREEVDRQHAACFDKAYTTKWGKWQDYSFNERKHADCVLRRVTADISRRNMAAVRARQPPSVTAATAARPPARPVAVWTPATPPPTLGRVAVGNVKVLRFTRSPQLTGHLTFVVIGSADAVASVGTCSYAVTCDGQAQGLPTGQRAIVACPVKAQGAKGEGELEFALSSPAPAAGACSLELLLTDGGRARSSVVVVPLS